MGSTCDSYLWFYDSSFYFDSNSEHKLEWDEKNINIFGYGRTKEGKMETVKFDQFNKKFSDTDHCVLLMMNRCLKILIWNSPSKLFPILC